MTAIVCSIKDAAIDAFGPPFFVRAEGEAKRMFKDEVDNPDSRINKHPGDFDLYKIGMYNDQTGEIQGFAPSRIARAVDYKEGNVA